jgi:hypothetical protein
VKKLFQFSSSAWPIYAPLKNKNCVSENEKGRNLRAVLQITLYHKMQ